LFNKGSAGSIELLNPLNIYKFANPITDLNNFI